jgi:MFS family permease
VLLAEGVYRELCNTDNESHSDFNLFGVVDDDLQIPCPEQDIRLNFFFIAASNTANLSTLLAGAALDRFGRRTCYMISSGLLAVGCILMGSAFAIPKFDGYLLGNLFLAFGGTFLFVPSFQLANAFPKHSGIVVALVTGAFDSSAAVFLFYRMAHDAFKGRFSPSQFFFGYLFVPMLIFLAELTFMPSKAYHSTLELEQKIRKAQDSTRDIHESDDEITSDSILRRVRGIRAEHRHAKLDQIEDMLGDVNELQQRVKLVEEREANYGAWGALHNVPTHKQMLTPWFILLLLLTIIQMLRMNYFIATIRSQYRYMLHSDNAAVDINHFFDAALPIAGVVSTPFIGLLLNKLSVTTTLAILTVFIALLGTLNCLPFLWSGYATVLAFVIFRPFYYSVMS